MANNYDQVKMCYECNGHNLQCQTYAPAETSLCAWKQTVMSDLEKFSEGRPELTTFPILEKIVLDDIQPKMGVEHENFD